MSSTDNEGKPNLTKRVLSRRDVLLAGTSFGAVSIFGSARAQAPAAAPPIKIGG